MDYIEIDKDSLPYRFDISIADEPFTMEVHYNAEYDFFAVDLEDSDGNVLVSGEKLVYGQSLFVDVWDSRFPKLPLVPWDESEQSAEVTWNTLGTSVFLYIVDAEDEDDGS
ncbi:hypothetical protein KIH86_03680 [Paenibacillus sp. HN-1]|uniref:phage baseplate plug family protein n=1 Tax=Paenibacillus TaxID=44249 RepID=UPI001CA98AD4|nr:MULTISPECIES: hypothetical protein [Paenibacillus]MBY9077283.1 hypothetical protein [Paenibacillus sp. CGMCC 1.18879]MBY9083330.1 hypothetical protein [Paenibacillus sinensis]